MPLHQDETIMESPAHTDIEKNPKKRRRIPRACDRCRLKKSKCDGARVCRACKATDSTCLYRTRRNRESKNYYWHMRDITDEALFRLYWASRNGTGFPGEVPDETGEKLTVNAILQGLGLTEPIEEDAAKNSLPSSPTRSTYPLKALPRDLPILSLMPDEPTTSANSSANSSRANSASTASTIEPVRGTRLQRQFQKQLQTPTALTLPHTKVPVGESRPGCSDMDASLHAYHKPRNNRSEASQPWVQADASASSPFTGEGLMSSQFFDIETVGITPGLNIDDLDFPYPQDLSHLRPLDVTMFPA